MRGEMRFGGWSEGWRRGNRWETRLLTRGLVGFLGFWEGGDGGFLGLRDG